MYHVLSNNGYNIPTHLRQRIACIQALLSANAKTEYQIAEKKAKTLFLESYEDVDLEAVLTDEDLFYEYLDMESGKKIFWNLVYLWKITLIMSTPSMSTTLSFNSR